LGFGRGANDLTPENVSLTKPWTRPRPGQSYSASKGGGGEEEDNKELYTQIWYRGLRVIIETPKPTPQINLVPIVTMKYVTKR
jgi:hypothetical protein